jgi:prepilin-type N-terminal cleavage/methylation domain-containing protein
VVKRERGFTLIEIVVVLAIFGIFIWIIVILTADMRAWEKRMPVNFMTHPQISAVVSRLRKDVADARWPYYPNSLGTWQQGPATLILDTLREAGTTETVVWDFSKDGEVTRLAFVAEQQQSAWKARGTPTFKILDYPIAEHPDSVRIQAYDKDGKLAIDQIFQPRAH